jgi:GH43 family beta-xylosidase
MTKPFAAIPLACTGLILTAQTPAPVPVADAFATFRNPLLPSGPDPWVIYRDGYYYFMNTTGNSLAIRKTHSIAALDSAETKVVWRPPATGPCSRHIWAPELHFLRGKWYIYFAADAGTNQSHRIWVIENSSADPLSGEWTLKGKVADPSDKWAIDASVFEHAGRMYMVWSGWEGDVNGVQSIYIAELSDPWTVKGHRVRISTPEYPWEKVGDRDLKRNREENPGRETEEPVHIDVNEGPEILKHGDSLFLVYSASACWTDSYSLGMLTASAAADLLDPSSWKKSALPVFWESPAANAYAPGHNGFFKSPDGTEDWIVYHANSRPGQGCGNSRSPRAQRFFWNADGTPDFGRPAAVGSSIPSPSGELVRVPVLQGR